MPRKYVKRVRKRPVRRRRNNQSGAGLFSSLGNAFKKIGKGIVSGVGFARKNKLISKLGPVLGDLALLSGNPVIAGKVKVGTKLGGQLGFGLARRRGRKPGPKKGSHNCRARRTRRVMRGGGFPGSKAGLGVVRFR